MICISKFILQLYVRYKDTDKNVCPICFPTFEDLLCILFDLCSLLLPLLHCYSLPFLRVLFFSYLLVLFFSSSIGNLTFVSFPLFSAPFSITLNIAVTFTTAPESFCQNNSF